MKICAKFCDIVSEPVKKSVENNVFQQIVVQNLTVQHEYFFEFHVKIAIYAPMIHTAPSVMFLMRADPLRGQVGGGWALEKWILRVFLAL
jgi:hypothetical protein